MSTPTVDGNLSLPEQNQTLEAHQQRTRSKVVTYDKDNVQIRNLATFEKLPLGAKIPTLTLVVVPPGQNPSAVQPSNSTLTFHGLAFVSGIVTHLAGFHSA